MRLKMLACKVFFREVSLIAAVSENYVDVTYIRQGLHNTPDLLRKVLQAEIDKIDNGDDVYTYKSRYDYKERDFDAILLGYGLCSNGLVGLNSKKYPLVAPRTHDCIALFLGSHQTYQDYFNTHGGTYWYNASWIENSSFMPSEESEKALSAIYTERYGEEGAQFLLEQEWPDSYERCVYIKWDEMNFPQYEKYTKDAADYLGVNFDVVQGDSGMLRDFINGNWDEDRFLVTQPGQKIIADYSDSQQIITAEWQ
ncbi:MAG: DUF1638 domain-containing protein [Synergistaceae bacterium]|jgi:hypothetical protein|nr:DUF1638 domain-containing protein [Synergistaceae bacterium]